jgi:hypothetical protein
VKKPNRNEWLGVVSLFLVVVLLPVPGLARNSQGDTPISLDKRNSERGVRQQTTRYRCDCERGRRHSHPFGRWDLFLEVYLGRATTDSVTHNTHVKANLKSSPVLCYACWS